MNRNSEQQDHPRVCGEKSTPFGALWATLGSPPRVRGKVEARVQHRDDPGITPACAGKRLQERPKTLEAWDHPRVCGEKEASGFIDKMEQGSPPRVRGKAVIRTVKCFHFGITPACAGKRLKRSHSIGHFSCILCLFHSVLHRASVSGGSRAGPCAPPCLPAQNAVPV